MTDILQDYVPYVRRTLMRAPDKIEPPTLGHLRHLGLDVDNIRLMGLNESRFPPSPKVIEALRENLSRINLYPDAQCPALSDIISERTGIDRECIVWGNGSEELLKGAIDLSLSPGEGLVLPVPTFWGYNSMVEAFGADVAKIENLPDGHTDIDGLLGAIEDHTRIVILITPNNPTGRVVDQDGIETVVSGVPEDVLLCVDEAYFDFGIHEGGPNVLSALRRRRGPWVTVFTFSKAYAMAGMRIGYALCSDEVVANALRKTTCVFNVPILAQFAAEAALLDTDYLEQMLDWVAASREQLAGGLVNLGLDPIPSVCNFVSAALPMDGRQCVRSMLDRGIQINAWADKGYEKYVRITVGTEDDNTACLACLEQVLDEHG